MTIENFNFHEDQYLEDSYVHLRGIVCEDLLSALQQAALKGRFFTA